jgi:hypothetical protein
VRTGLALAGFSVSLDGMTDSLQQGAIDSPPEFSADKAHGTAARFDRHRHDDGRITQDDAPWPMRAWIMALISACVGLLLFLTVEHGDTWVAERTAMTFAVFLTISTVSFVLGVERRRWTWALSFSLFWGVIAALVFWQTLSAADGRGPFAWPFVSVVLAILIATPFFQTRRDVALGRRQWKLWELPYGRLHDHAWLDAVIGAAALLFTLIAFLLVLMIGGMFSMIGIKFISKLMNEGWFVMGLAGGAFGGAVGLLRERDRLVAVMQRLVMAVLSVLAPVLAAAVVLFLLSMLGTGLSTLWSRGFSASYLLLGVAAAAVLLANAVIGNAQEDVAPNRVLRLAAGALAVVVLPLAALSMIGIALRVGQYGWTPDRLWGALAVAVALGYGVAGLWSVLRGREDFADLLRLYQQKLAVGVMIIAFVLATPLVDFGAISARNQVARLQSGAVTAKAFDWGALAFDFGPSGREALKQLSRSDNKQWADLATGALKGKSRWASQMAAEVVTAAPFEERVRVLPQGAVLSPDARGKVDEIPLCRNAHGCLVYVLGPKHIAVLTQSEAGQRIHQQELVQNAKGDWGSPEWAVWQDGDHQWPDLKTADVEMLTVQRQQLQIGGEKQPILEQELR